MARFVPDQPITTTTPTVVVDAGLRPGLHRFALLVVDGSGQRSVADVVRLQVQEVVTPQPPPVPTPGPLRPPLRPVQPILAPRPLAASPTGGTPPPDQEPTP